MLSRDFRVLEEEVLLDVPADPAFKEALREKLWDMIQSKSFGYGRPPKN